MIGHGRQSLVLALAIAASLPGALPAAARDALAEAKGAGIYRLRRGDTLFDLDRSYLVGTHAVAELCKLNRIANPDRILAGTRLRIPRALLRDERSYARVETFSGPVLLTIGDQPVTARLGFALSENAMIETGRNAFVTLRLGDGSALAVPSQSRIRIASLRRILLTGTVEREIAVIAGRARARVTPMHDPASTFRVVTPISVSAVRGTDFAIAYDPESRRSSTVVEEGRVVVNRPGSADTLALLPGFGASSGTQGTTGAVKLLPEPALVDPGQIQTGAQLQFTLVPEAGAVAYHLEIAKDAGGLGLISEQSAAGLAFTLPSVPAGGYFLRAFAIDGNGLQGLPATYAFTRRLNTVSATMTRSGSGRLIRYLFRWDTASDGAAQIRFRLLRQPAEPGAGHDGAPIAIVDEPGLKTNSLEIANLPNGTYAWQVSSTLMSDGKPIVSWSPEQTFHIVGRR